MSYRGDGDRGFRGGGARGSDRGGTRGGDRGGSRGGFRGGDRGGFRGGDRGGFRGGDRGGFRGGDRGGFRGGDRGGRGGGRGGFGGPREQAGIFSDPEQSHEIDSRLATAQQDALVRSLQSLSIRSEEPRIPVRPGWGTLGRQIKLRSNFFAVKFPSGDYYEYSVKISPALKGRAKIKRFFQIIEMHPLYARHRGYVAHDFSALLFSARELPQPFAMEGLAYYHAEEAGPTEKSDKYNVEIVFTRTLEYSVLTRYLSGDLQYIDFDIAPLVHALNIVLSQYPSRSSVMVGQNRFFFPEEIFTMTGGLEAWKGFYSSVRPAYRQLMVNVNAATTAFYTEGNLADAMIQYRNHTFGANVNSFVSGLGVITTHLNHRKRIKRLSKKNSQSHWFQWDELERQVSTEEYFEKKYGIKLKHPEMPLVQFGGGTKEKQILVPPEVCYIVPRQPFRGKLSDEHSAQMLLHACKPPNVNANTIVRSGLVNLGFKSTEEPLRGFGISVSSQMAVVPGRILEAPGVVYAQRPQEVDQRASWNLRGVKFSKGAVLDNWQVLILRDGNRTDFAGANDPDLARTISGFIDLCQKSGLAVRSRPSYAVAELPQKRVDDPTRKAAIAKIRNTITSGPKVNLIMVLLSSSDRAIYSGVKHLCDVSLDVHTVCVQADKFKREKGQLQYFANVALKFNMKLGGVNHSLDPKSMQWFKQQPTMLVGMDVTHSGPGSLKGTPSIAAVVASVDDQYAQFPASMRLQESRKEMIDKLSEIMIERLELFRSRSRILPQRILIYRDGVSEGQFQTVINEEMPEILGSFRKYDQPGRPYRPKLTIVICGKRHHTRFYPTEPSHADNLGNPLPGTVVDQGVTAVYAFDFFLQAHGSLQGTSRPTHYYVVHDENRFSADQLQKLTNDISYMFARATKAVSLVSPAYYADLACERGRCYIQELFQTFDDTTTSSSGEDQVMRRAQDLWRDGVSGRILKDTMFYL